MNKEKQQNLCDRDELLTQLARNDNNSYGYLLRGRQGIFPPSVAQRYGVPETVCDMPDWMVAQGNVAPDSIDPWLHLFSAIEHGEKHDSVKVSLKSESGIFIRYRLYSNVFTDEDGLPFFAMVFFEDIAEEHEQNRMQNQDISGLLQATQKTFPELLTLNLSKGTYRIISYHNATTLGTPREGLIDDMIRIRMNGVIEEDRENFAETFSYEALKDAFIQQGKETRQLVYRRPGNDGNTYWFESKVTRQENEFDDDVLLTVMSRSIDERKAEEMRLREQLWLQAEEIRVTTNKMRRTICYIDVPTMTLTVPSSYAKENNMPEVIPNYPKNMKLSQSKHSQKTTKMLLDLCDAITRGEPTGTFEVSFDTIDKGIIWKRMEYTMVFDRKGNPQRAVIFVEDITDQRLQARENIQLKENERILRLIAQHSDRIICYYDIQNEIARPWDPKICKRCRLPHLCEMSTEVLLKSGKIFPESEEELRNMFQSIHNGSPKGSLRIRAKTTDGQSRWFDLQYSTIFNEGIPVSALISHKDITEQYEHELAYLRHIQILTESKNHLGTLEVDLDTDLIENQRGRMIPDDFRSTGVTMAKFALQMIPMKMLEKDQAEGFSFFSREYLKAQYADGIRHLERVWQMWFRDGSLGWVGVEAEIVRDPYTDHLKVFFHMKDITKEKTAQLEIQSLSERDGMTGLLNRITAEKRIQEHIAQKEHAGILILLDLDDLKGINDTYGHSEGDRSILGIANTLKSHFREMDIIGRIGGDEFLVFLPGSTENSGTIAVSIATLLRKLASIAIGPNDERRIHCSIGCAVQTAKANTLETLFRQADMALYHVKRNGKNNFAFYSPEMEDTNYQFKSQKLFSSNSMRKFDMGELQFLLEAFAIFYPLMLSANLSANDYYLMEDMGMLSSHIPTFGILDEFVENTLGLIHPNDMSIFKDSMSRASLLREYEQGKKMIRRYFRILRGDNYLWTEAAVIFYVNVHGDICEFTLVRWANERAYELDQLWLYKVMELATTSSFEYICLVNVENGDYTLYGNIENKHDVAKQGNFDEITRYLRDNFILPEERADYYEKAKLSSVISHMANENQTYNYYFHMQDGEREASFHWFEPTHTQLLMVVQHR